MSIEKLRRIDAAVVQLHRAIELYLSGDDYVSAITLAGAAEGMLGEWLKALKQPHSLEELRPIIAELTLQATGRTLTDRENSDDLNDVRNWLKHYTPPDERETDAREEAYAMLDRAVVNFWMLTRSYTEPMLRFLKAEQLEP